MSTAIERTAVKPAPPPALKVMRDRTTIIEAVHPWQQNPLLAILNFVVQYQLELDRTFSALSDPTRRAILERLGRGPATIGELAEPFGMSLTGLKKHVHVLEEADLVVTQKVGRTRRCRLGPGRLEDATRWIEEHRSRWERRLDRLEGYIEERRRGEG